jgi:transcriptional regulator
MHLPAVSAEFSPPILRQFMRENALGIITTAIKSSKYPFLQTSHIPWIIDVDDDSSETQLGKLRGHIARQNPQAQAIIESLTSDLADGAVSQSALLEDDVLVLFNGPVHHYVTPKFYTETKPRTGKVAPTWNYEAVQVYGTARIYFDSKSKETLDFLSQQLTALAHYAETSVMGYGREGQPQPWGMNEAPDRYIELLKKNIIGIEIDIKSMAGRFKMTQEKGKGDRQGVIEGFRNLNTAAGTQIADIIEQRCAFSDAKKEEKSLS